MFDPQTNTHRVVHDVTITQLLLPARKQNANTKIFKAYYTAYVHGVRVLLGITPFIDIKHKQDINKQSNANPEIPEHRRAGIGALFVLPKHQQTGNNRCYVT